MQWVNITTNIIRKYLVIDRTPIFITDCATATNQSATSTQVNTLVYYFLEHSYADQFFEPTCANARWAYMHHFPFVCL